MIVLIIIAATLLLCYIGLDISTSRFRLYYIGQSEKPSYKYITNVNYLGRDYKTSVTWYCFYIRVKEVLECVRGFVNLTRFNM